MMCSRRVPWWWESKWNLPHGVPHAFISLVFRVLQWRVVKPCNLVLSWGTNIGWGQQQQGRIQDFGQGESAEFWPQGGPEPKKFGQNCLKMAWFKKKSWRQWGGLGPKAPLDPLVSSPTQYLLAKPKPTTGLSAKGNKLHIACSHMSSNVCCQLWKVRSTTTWWLLCNEKGIPLAHNEAFLLPSLPLSLFLSLQMEISFESFPCPLRDGKQRNETSLFLSLCLSLSSGEQLDYFPFTLKEHESKQSAQKTSNKFHSWRYSGRLILLSSTKGEKKKHSLSRHLRPCLCNVTWLTEMEQDGSLPSCHGGQVW